MSPTHRWPWLAIAACILAPSALWAEGTGNALPLTIEALQRQAEACDVTGRPEAIPEVEATLAAVDRELARRQQSCLLRIRRARLLALAGRFPEALVELNWVLQRRPNNADARQSRGAVLFVLGEHAKARTDFLEALASAPGRLFLARYVRMCNEALCLQCPCNRPRMRPVPACVH